VQEYWPRFSSCRVRPGWREFGRLDDVHFPQAALTIAEVSDQGVALTTAEALAIVQLLIEASGHEEARPPYGPPLPENILIRVDGSVASRGCAVTPTVFEMAILLDQLLPPGQQQVPGALRYTLGRALHEVAAPPFDSLETFSQALRRFEAGGRTEMVRGVFARAAAQESGAATARAVLGLPFAAAILAGLALIGAGQSMRTSRPFIAITGGATQQATLADARPIVFNPPPTAVRLPVRSVVVQRPESMPHRVLTRRVLKPPPSQQRRLGAPSRFMPRLRIRVDEL
jgi:hypothetical protein